MPQFHCRLAGSPEGEARPQQAPLASIAAEQFRRRYDADTLEYPEERDVLVRAPDGTEEVWTVAVRAVPEYTAMPKRRKS